MKFATVEEGRALLGKSDAFIERLSPFDRASRLQTDNEVTTECFLKHVVGCVEEWSEDEKATLGSAIEYVTKRIKDLNVRLPTDVILVKTSGDEEGGAPYTRGATIVFPGLKSLRGDVFVRKVIAHELFHVLSRNNPEVRQQLYASIGFFPCGEISHPESLAVRRITNPDAPRNEYAIEVTVSGETRTVVPILYSRSATYDVDRGGHFFEYLEFRLLQIERVAEGRAWVSSEEYGSPVLFEVGNVVGFYEKIGRNTEYVIHPEEVLADNFALLVQGETEVKSPEILTKMKEILIQAGAKEKE